MEQGKPIALLWLGAQIEMTKHELRALIDALPRRQDILPGPRLCFQFAICKPELLNDFVACKRHDPQQLGVADLCHFQRWVRDRILFRLYDEPAFIPI